jgi:hypothetical protein
MQTQRLAYVDAIDIIARRKAVRPGSLSSFEKRIKQRWTRDNESKTKYLIAAGNSRNVAFSDKIFEVVNEFV